MQHNVLQEKEVSLYDYFNQNDEDTMLFKKYATMNGLSVSELIRQSVIEHIEDEYDLKTYEKVIEEYKNNPVTYSLDEVKKELGL